MKECKASPVDKAIGNLRSYVAVISYHTCYEYLRLKYPQRHNLKNKLRYLLTHQPMSLREKLLSFERGWRERSEGFWRSSAFWLPVRLASLGLVVALLLWAAILKSHNSQLQTALRDQQQEIEKLKQDYQAVNASATELQNQPAQLRSTQIAGHPSSSIVVALNDGAGQVTLDKEGNVAVAPSPCVSFITIGSSTLRMPH